MKYLTLFSLEIVHAYYADRRCLDFHIQPTPGTQKILSDLRCVLKSFPNGIRVLISVDDQDKPFIAVPENSIFSFQLQLQNPEFILFTDLDEFSETLAPLYTNAAQSTDLDLILTSREAWFSEQFVVQHPDQDQLEAFTLGGDPLENIKTTEFVIKGLGKKSTAKSFEAASRVLKVNSAGATSGTPFTVTYPVTPGLEQGVFADVEIQYSNTLATPSKNANVFRIVFTPKQTRWKYYVVMNKTDNKAVIPSLEDKEKKLAFNAGEQIDLSLGSDPAEVIASRLVEKYPNKQCFRFTSSELVACQEVARKGIQLKLGDEKVVDCLPNPSIQNFSIDPKDATQMYALYQIVEYFTR